MKYSPDLAIVLAQVRKNNICLVGSNASGIRSENYESHRRGFFCFNDTCSCPRQKNMYRFPFERRG